MTIPRNFDQATIPGTYVHILIDIVSRWHISAELFLWGSGITQEQLKDIRWHVSYSVYAKLLQRAVELTQEPGLGFYFGMQLKVSSHGLMGLTVSVAKNMREAIETLIHFAKLQGTAARFRLEVGEQASLYIEENFFDFNNELDRLAYEIGTIYVVIGLINMVRSVTNSEFKPEVDLRCAEPQYFERFANILNAMIETIHYEQPLTCLRFPLSFLELPLVTADPVTANLLREQCQQELDELISHQNIAHLVRELIYDEATGIRGIEEVADKLKMSVRTLQRILQENGSQFQRIYNNVRMHKAKFLLEYKELSLIEIADKLSYSDVTSFNRAFKNYAGISPGKFRVK